MKRKRIRDKVKGAITIRKTLLSSLRKVSRCWISNTQLVIQYVRNKKDYSVLCMEEGNEEYYRQFVLNCNHVVRHSRASYFPWETHNFLQVLVLFHPHMSWRTLMAFCSACIYGRDRKLVGNMLLQFFFIKDVSIRLFRNCYAW